MTLLKLAVATTLTFGGAANAAITVFTDQAAFLAAVGSTGVDTFDDVTGDPHTGPLSRTAGAYGYTATVGPQSDVFYGGTDNGVDFFLSSDGRLDTITLDGFAANVHAAGGFFFGSDLSGHTHAAASITIDVTDADGATSLVALNPGTGTFRGFLSTGSLLSMSFLVGDQPGVWPSLNNLTLASGLAVPTGPTVPEPATWALMIAGLGVVGVAMRRRAALAA